MKRIEAVITPWTLDAFKEAAPKLGISEFNIVEVHRSGCAATEGQKRLYRGVEYRVELLPRLKLEFVLFDDDIKATLEKLMDLVQPDSIAVFKLDQTLWPAKANLSNPSSLGRKANRPAGATIRQIGRLAP
jgi:nitrogen regulatory protein P-II 1